MSVLPSSSSGPAPTPARPVRSTFSQAQAAPSAPKTWEVLLSTVDRFAREAIARDAAHDLPQALSLYRRAVAAWQGREGRPRLPPELRETIEPRIRNYEVRAAELAALVEQTSAGSGPIPAGASGPGGADADVLGAILQRVLATRVTKPPEVVFEDIAGCERAKRQLLGAIRLPLLAPQLFRGGRQAPGGILLYGPPGTGKTMLAKAAANLVKSAMFVVDAADVTDKYLGESEKFIKALFDIARSQAPAIVFIDEIDALLGVRRSDESDAVRRIKNQFFTAMQGFHGDAVSRVLVIGATNRPWDLDDGAKRRFEQRIHVPLPDAAARARIFAHLLHGLGPQLTADDYARFAAASRGYSGADVAAVVRAAAMLPIMPLIHAEHVAPDADGRFRASRADAPDCVAVANADLSQLDLFDDVRPEDVDAAMASFRPSVSAATVAQFAAYEVSFSSQEF